MDLSRRQLILGIGTAPAILKLGLWMPIKSVVEPWSYEALEVFWLQRSIKRSIEEVLMGPPRPLYYNDAGIHVIKQATMKAIKQWEGM